MRLPRAHRVVSLTALFALLMTGTALAGVVGLPPSGVQVNKDAATGIDPNQSGGTTDVVGGSLIADAAESPWITFEQRSGSAQHIFVRSFNGTKWVTRGQSLNIDPKVEAEAPSIDFAGPGRATPWTSWYEPSARFHGKTQIFASRFCAAASSVCGAGNIWVPEGRDRAAGHLIPSLNIHTGKDAENPSVAGGATVAGADPGPWVTWEEQDGSVGGSGNHDQIFVSKPIKNASQHAACPVGTKPGGGNSVGFFCWQQVGIERLAPNGGANATDPSLNVDPSRNGVQPDIAFTGPSDTVAWVVWYETGKSGLGLRANEQVFAAKLVANAAADGGFQWQAVGQGTAGETETLDRSGTHGFGDCSASKAHEDACSLNKIASENAQDPRVAAGTLVQGSPTVPWVVWSEDVGGTHEIFVAHLVGGDHFELFNGGQPVSNITRNASLPDITFLGNEPVISWNEGGFPGGKRRAFLGHFTGGAASPTFVLDTPHGVPVPGTTNPANVVNFRPSDASTCQADPATGDGSACPGGGSGFAFLSFTQAGTPRKIFAERQK